MGKRSREEQLKNLSLQKSNTNWTKYLIIIVIMFALAAAIGGLIFLSSKNNKTANSELGEVITAPAPPNTSRHVRQGEEHVSYTSNPPTSGPHFAGLTSADGIGPIQCKTYKEEVIDEGVIHNLEHGVVWVTYKDKNDKDLAEKLKNITEKYPKVVLSPRAANDSKIALASWTRLLKLEEFDETKIADFIKLYRSSEAAPEKFASCGTTHSGN